MRRGRRAVELMEQEHQVLVELVRRDDPTAGLADGSVDAALLWGRVDDPRYTAVEVLREERVAAISHRSTLAVRDSVTWGDLGRRCLVLNTVSGTLTPDDWPTGARPEIGAEAANLDEYLHAVAARRGVGALPASVAAGHPDPDVRYLPVAGAPPAVLSYVRPRTNPHPHAEQLATVLTEDAAQDRPRGRSAATTPRTTPAC
ncbi:LysR substrate-binding domain-containing protein [Streptomyces resistomycificus]|nr:LysR substrate-binding domain-containing protein [Streptomyces resistomycificus]